MSYTKGELVSAALEEIGIADYDYDISVEQRQSAIRRLDMMMAQWSARRIRLSFPIAKQEDSSPDGDSCIPDWAWEAVITNLAIRLAPSYGKTVSQETKSAAKNSFNVLCGMFSNAKKMQLPSMPKGAGYKATDFRYTPEPESEYLDNVDESFDPSGGPI